MADTQKLRRRLIQLTAALVYNADVSRWFSGKISRSPLKHVCVPGLNCYSCPGAVASCPIGSLQNTIGGGRFPFFITGFLMLTGTLLGRMVCAFLCPVGLVQELLYKIPSRKVKKTERLLKVTRRASLLKYAVLAVLCIALPLVFYFRDGIASPLFCKFVCPAGTAEAGIPRVLMNEPLRSSIGCPGMPASAPFFSPLLFWSRNTVPLMLDGTISAKLLPVEPLTSLLPF